jgi:hypothetical protein
MIPEVGQIVARREDTTASGDHRYVYVRITVSFRNARGQRVIHGNVEGVAFGGSVDRQDSDTGLHSLGVYRHVNRAEDVVVMVNGFRSGKSVLR